MAKPTQEQIDYLKAHPELAARFDAKFGEGMAAKILPKSALTQYAGAVTRGMAAPMVGAAMGAPFGPVGMLAGSLAVPAGDVLTSVINAIAAGGEAVSGRELGRVTPPSQMIQDLLTRAGVAKPETTGQRMVETGVGALGGTAAQLPGLMKMAKIGRAHV